MWNMTKYDEEYYARKKVQARLRHERITALNADLHRRMAILAKVKRGEISLAAARILIKGREGKG